MFFDLLFKKRKKKVLIQQEYTDLIRVILNSPLWDGSDEQIYQSLPADLNAETVAYVKNSFSRKDS